MIYDDGENDGYILNDVPIEVLLIDSDEEDDS